MSSLKNICLDLKTDFKTIYHELRAHWWQVLATLAGIIAACVLLTLYMAAPEELYERWIQPIMLVTTVLGFLGFVVVMALHANLGNHSSK